MTEAVMTDRVNAGDHACLTFSDLEERLDLVSAFVRDGLRGGQKVVCWTDSITPDELAGQLAARAVRPGAAVRRGQLRIAPVSAGLLGGAAVNATAMVEVLAGEVDRAGREGFPGLRVTADMAWATRPRVASEELLAFESAVAGLFSDGRLCLICQYDRDRFDAVTLAFAAKAHPKTLAAQVYHDHPLLRICRQYSPPGIRIAGQLDYRHTEILEQALGESLRLDRHMHLNLTGLDYIDGACAGLILATAMQLSASRRMTITCRRAAATVLELVGAHAAGRLRVHQTNEQG
jgi:anti-anti-sigma regulatory factor